MSIEVIRNFRSTLDYLSGSGKRLARSQRHNGIYSTVTLPGFQDLRAVRDTLRRFDDFGVKRVLRGKTLIDVGSNVGAMSFEAALRGAVVTGLEFNDERVSLCREMARYYGEPRIFPPGVTPDVLETWQCEVIAKASFAQCDFNDVAWLDADDGRWDVVLCSSVDTYMDDRAAFYAKLRRLCADDGVLYLESNVQHGFSELDAVRALRNVGFREVSYLGNGHSGGISRKRKLYRARP